MDRELQKKGMAVRKSVLGAEYVEKNMATADDFNRPFQDILNEYCWGMIWT
ncbi:MAG: 4-carboxymuconolactone decarboxylase, partial [Hyphomicrobiaceae bacterium]